MESGPIQLRAADGTLKPPLVSPFYAPAKGLAFDAAGNLFVSHWWDAGGTTGNTLVKFRPDGSYIGSFGSLYYCNPTGMIVDKNGNVFVGEAECERKIVKLSSAGLVVETFHVPFEIGGVRWLELAANGCSLYYTSASVNILRYDVCSSTPLT